MRPMLLSISRNGTICAKYIGITSDKWIYARQLYSTLKDWPMYLQIRRIDTNKTGETLFYQDKDDIKHEVHPHVFSSDYDYPIFSKRLLKLYEDDSNNLEIINDINSVIEEGFKSDRSLKY